MCSGQAPHAVSEKCLHGFFVQSGENYGDTKLIGALPLNVTHLICTGSSQHCGACRKVLQEVGLDLA